MNEAIEAALHPYRPSGDRIDKLIIDLSQALCGYMAQEISTACEQRLAILKKELDACHWAEGEVLEWQRQLKEATGSASTERYTKPIEEETVFEELDTDADAIAREKSRLLAAYIVRNYLLRYTQAGVLLAIKPINKAIEEACAKFKQLNRRREHLIGETVCTRASMEANIPL